MNALQARTARPDDEAKAQAWQTVMVDRKIPPGMIGRVGRAFWRPDQEELVTPYAEQFLQSLVRIGDAGMLWALSLSYSFFPSAGGEPGYLDRLEVAAASDDVSPVVRQTVRDANDRRRRRDTSRAAATEAARV